MVVGQVGGSRLRIILSGPVLFVVWGSWSLGQRSMISKPKRAWFVDVVNGGMDNKWSAFFFPPRGEKMRSALIIVLDNNNSWKRVELRPGCLAER